MAKRTPKKINKKNNEIREASYPRANVIQRIGAYILDTLSVTVLLLMATVFAVLIVFIGTKTALLDVQAHQGIANYLAHSLLFAAYLAAIVIAFYGHFWSKAGQTPGMKVFRLRVQNCDGSKISFTQSLIRMATSAFGLGNLLSVFSDKNSFQDSWAECEVIVLPKELNNSTSFKDLIFVESKK